MATNVTADGRARVLADGNEIPLLGLGVWQVNDGRECEDAVRWALELGYRHIDTAQAYGNERSVGNALRDSGVPREDVFITTKFNPAKADAEEEAQALARAPRRRLRRPLHHPLAAGRADVGLGRDAARPGGGLRALDRRLELQRARGRRAAGDLRRRPGRQPGPVQPVRVPARAVGGVRGALDRAGGLQPARHRPPPRRPGRGRDRRAARPHARAGADPLGAGAQPDRAAQVDAPRAHRGQRAGLRLHLSESDVAALDALDHTGGTAAARESIWW